jgi:hypothetical protein
MNAAWLDTIYTDVLSLLCVVLGAVVFLANLRYARDGLAKPLRQYLAVKGLIALFVAFVYALTLVNVFEPAPPSGLSRSLMGLLLLLMFLDTVVRDADANVALKTLMEKMRLEKAADAEALANGQAPQEVAEVPKDA